MPPVTAAQVAIDYILDERLREFGVEEKRMLTLMRLGKWADRVKRFNPFYGTRMLDKYNLRRSLPMKSKETGRPN